jgi:asparagine synthase (glutamine-hydrolysing)
MALSSRSNGRVTREAIDRMRDVMIHRGPDGAGSYLGECVALGHRRLSIVDVEHGAQPMSTDDGQVHLIYNGEIFNHPVLFAQLQKEGVTYHTRCDTETILRLYERHGRECASHLRGMFAFAVWDARRSELLLVRDRFGVKPLYYSHLDDGSLYFGSEIKSILASGAVRPAAEHGRLPDYWLITRHRERRRCSPEYAGFQGTPRLARQRSRFLRIGTSISAKLTSAVTPSWWTSTAALSMPCACASCPTCHWACSSSGGIDSASITAAMSTMVSEPIKTFSVAFAEREANELSYARLVAERYHTDHHEVVVTPEQFWGAVPKLIWHEDEPMAHPSSVALNFVSRLAAERVKVVLTGEGSDETLAGYNRYRVTVFNQRLGTQWERWVPGQVRSGVRGAIAALSSRSRVRQKLSRTALVLPAELTTLYFDNFAVFSRERQRRLLSPALQDSLGSVDPYGAAHRALEHCDARTLLDQLLYADTKTYLQELLMKQDQMSMAASIESRVPFLDHPLVEFAARLPQRLKLRGWTTKYVLRRAMRGLLPPEILARRKMGFPVPVGAWLRAGYRPIVDEFVLGPRALARGLFDAETLRSIAAAHASGSENHGQRLWALVNFEIWQRIFLDGEPVDTIGMPVPDA